MSNKKRVKKVIKHTHSYGEGADKMLGMLKEFAKDWEGRQKQLVEKHNEMAAQLAAQEKLTQQVANFAAAEFGKMQARLNLYFQSIDGALHHHDVNDLAAAELLKEIFGQLTQAEFLFKRLLIAVGPFAGDMLGLDDGEVASIKKEAMEWYDELLKSAFKTANETVERQRQEAEEARKAEEQRIAAEKQKAAEDKAEAERMEAELHKAEGQDRGLVEVPSSEQEALGIPADVRIFGMT